jgi:hypothetical protein
MTFTLLPLWASSFRKARVESAWIKFSFVMTTPFADSPARTSKESKLTNSAPANNAPVIDFFH